MPKVGVEPTLPKGNYALNVARLPVPPLRLQAIFYSDSLVCQREHKLWRAKHVRDYSEKWVCGVLRTPHIHFSGFFPDHAIISSRVL